MPYPMRWPTFEEFFTALKEHYFVEMRKETPGIKVKGGPARDYLVLSRSTPEGPLEAIAYPLADGKREIGRDEMRSICRQLQVNVRELEIGFELGIPGDAEDD